MFLEKEIKKLQIHIRKKFADSLYFIETENVI